MIHQSVCARHLTRMFDSVLPNMVTYFSSLGFPHYTFQFQMTTNDIRTVDYQYAKRHWHVKPRVEFTEVHCCCQSVFFELVWSTGLREAGARKKRTIMARSTPGYQAKRPNRRKLGGRCSHHYYLLLHLHPHNVCQPLGPSYQEIPQVFETSIPGP